jgi:F-type H+-transporting ATPase subunit epsilon
MAHNRFVAEVLTPEGEVFNEEVEMLSTRTTVGSIGLLANHEPLLARLEPTELRLYRSETEIVRYAQAEGYVQMSDNHALVLVEEAVEPSRLNAAELAERVEAARRAGEQAPPGSEEAARAQRDLRRAEAFLAIANGAH